MSKITTHNRADEDEELVEDYDETEELEEDYEGGEEEASVQAATPVVISDSRARRKRKRGELVEMTTADDVAAAPKKDRAVTGRRSTAKIATGPTRAQVIGGVIEKIPVVRTVYRFLILGTYNYLSAAVAEMRKVTWPTREETIHLTRLVLAVTIVFSLGLGIMDTFYGWWFKQALDNDRLFLLVAVGVLALAATLTWYVFMREDEYSPF